MFNETRWPAELRSPRGQLFTSRSLAPMPGVGATGGGSANMTGVGALLVERSLNKLLQKA